MESRRGGSKLFYEERLLITTFLLPTIHVTYDELDDEQKKDTERQCVQHAQNPCEGAVFVGFLDTSSEEMTVHERTSERALILYHSTRTKQ